MRIIFKILLGAGIIIGLILLAAYMYGIYNMFSLFYNFLTAVD